MSLLHLYLDYAALGHLYLKVVVFFFCKLITIVIGQNDLCRLTCRRNDSTHIQTAKTFARNVKKAVDILYNQVPKALISIVLPPGKNILV